MPLECDLSEWLEISVSVDGEAAEAVSQVFNRYGVGGAVLELRVLDAPDDTYYSVAPKGSVKTYIPVEDEDTRQKIERALWLLGRLYPLPEPQFKVLAARDWAEAWRQNFGLQRVGCSFVIKPPWEAYTPAPGERIIELEPGMAFGTGLHPSTRLCLMALEDYLSPGDSALDLGTGSGILAIAAARLGANSVLALDIDPVAVNEARSNIERNGVSQQVRLYVGSLIPPANAKPGFYVPQGQRFDCVVVNILAEIIASLAPRLTGSLKPTGRIIASGIIEERLDIVLDAFAKFGLAIREEKREQDWVALIATLR
ncbi:MAG: 50S ribosomal protein L11 methyltransferase [Chloroflexi bacterium]|nr:50S ribosomal protein L11 methyltransferase [Chloroflexota bacterium]